jgi:teichuronic acid biosynthesis glycosyltransferase TuaG
MSNNELVSIITPSYNTADFIGHTIESVLAQTYQNWEMIIVDDASTDNSSEVINYFAERDSRIKPLFLKENKGQGNARNIATELAKGRFITFLDSDDLLDATKVEKHVQFMLSQNAVFSHTSYGFIDEEGNSILKPFHVSNHPISFSDLLKRAEISCLTAMYDTKAIGKYYMVDIRKKQDYELWLRILKEGYQSIPFDEVLAFYRQRKNSTTNNKKKLIFLHYNFLRKVIKLSVLQSLYYTFMWGFNGLKKYYF